MAGESENSFEERRSVERIDCRNVNVVCESLFSPFLLGLSRRSRALPVKDLSRKGIAFYSNKKYSVGQHLKVHLLLKPGQPTPTLRAEVCGVSPGAGDYQFKVGIHFIKVSPQIWKLLCHVHKEAERNNKQDPFESTKAGYALKKLRVLGEWRGRESRVIEGFPVEGKCRFVWAVRGTAAGRFTVAAFNKKRPDLLRTLISESGMHGLREGAFDIQCHGLISLDVRIESPYPMPWLIVSPYVEEGNAAS